jgi:16S rRNA (adenine1518-N6/adenine1519-N6)-dimethyltransferase
MATGSEAEGGKPTERPGAAALPAFKIVANLPYAIATPWLDEVLSGPLPIRMVLMLQQEAAQRYVAQPGSKAFGAISIFLQAAYDVAPGHRVAASCFYPRPDVESHLLHLVRKPAPFIFPAAAKVLIRACFQQRRKQIGALLRARLPDAAPQWRELLSASGLSEQARPEAIPVSWWVRFSALVPP